MCVQEGHLRSEMLDGMCSRGLQGEYSMTDLSRDCSASPTRNAFTATVFRSVLQAPAVLTARHVDMVRSVRIINVSARRTHAAGTARRYAIHPGIYHSRKMKERADRGCKIIQCKPWERCSYGHCVKKYGHDGNKGNDNHDDDDDTCQGKP
jgi:hypothetical protein